MHLLLLGLLFAVQDQPPKTCSLAGVAVNAATGAPLNKVELLAEPDGSDHAPPAGTTTDSKGNFTLVDLPAGSYHLKAVRNGYLDTYYGARSPGARGTLIKLDPGQELKDLQVKLFPFGVVAGTVRDADGEPMAGASIKLFRQDWSGPGRRIIQEDAEGVTDDLGQYRITSLEPGKYFVRADRRSQNEYGSRSPVDHSSHTADPPPVLVPTLYPGTTDPTAARTVEVGAGARVAGIDITLVRTRVFEVKGKVLAAAGMTGKRVWLEAVPGYAGLGLRLQGQSKDDKDDFEIHGVLPGSYILVARAEPVSNEKPRPGQLTIDFFRHQFIARQPLTVSGDMQGVRIAIGAGSDVTGRVIIEKSDSPDPAPSAATSAGGNAAGGFFESSVAFDSRTGQDGTRTPFNDDRTFSTFLYPDRYNVSVAMEKVVVKSIRADGVDIYAGGLTITDGSKPQIEIVLAAEGGQVEGVALDKDEKPVAGAVVLLAAAPELRSREDAWHDAVTDQNGRYHFDNVRPGDYKVFAWDDVAPQAWFDPDFLNDVETKGEPVTLAAKGHASAQVHILPPR